MPRSEAIRGSLTLFAYIKKQPLAAAEDFENIVAFPEELIGMFKDAFHDNRHIKVLDSPDDLWLKSLEERFMTPRVAREMDLRDARAEFFIELNGEPH